MNKTSDEFRNYNDSKRHEIVEQTYRKNHTQQTYKHVLDMKRDHLQFNKAKMNVWEAIENLDQVVDDSDPDAAFSQLYHAIQTAETLRKQWPNEDWLHVTGFIHDLGKILTLPTFGGLPQWNVVGDTFPVGCQFSSKICMPHLLAENPDTLDALYNTKYGVYSPNCGLNNIHMSWGHDEYMYRVCVHNGCKLPQVALSIIRFHSFYSWHRDGEYRHLMDDSDHASLVWVQRFQQADLYSKSDDLPDISQLVPYYKGLLDKYFPKTILDW